MKTTLSTLFATFVLGLLVPLHAENQATGYSLQVTDRDTSASSQITISEYCLFLNAVAPSDPLGLYEESRLEAGGYRLEEQNGDTTSCNLIVRSGEPGHYSYAVAEGKANLPINYLSWWNAAYYYDWLENAASADISQLQLTRSSPDESRPSGCLWQSIPQLPSCRYCSEATGRYFTAYDPYLHSSRSTFSRENVSTQVVVTSKNMIKAGGALL